MEKLLITGGAGFIGSCFVQRWIEKQNIDLVNFDALTYAGHLASLGGVAENPRYTFIHADLRSAKDIEQAICEHRPSMILHLAAETHVDRSIEKPNDFISTNVMGTSILLEATLHYWRTLSASEQEGFRFLHISTDEVYGPVGRKRVATEADAYAPTSPYAASKAAADHIARSYQQTYGLPVMIAHPTNNYGPRQFPEKLIPHFIFKSLRGEDLPLYGDGMQERDWLFVEDHCCALETLLFEGLPGESYHLGSQIVRTNLEVAQQVCTQIDRQQTAHPGESKERITFVEDRPGHDHRYALDCGKMERLFGWRPTISFEEGIATTVQWYLKNPQWIETVCQEYQGNRIGLL